MEHSHLQFGAFTHIAASHAYDETETRAYFDGTFTSTTPDLQYRTIPATEFPKIITSFIDGLRVLDSHKQNNNGLGKTIHASIVENQIRGSFYILKGMKVGDEFQEMQLDDQSYPYTRNWIMGLKDGMIDSCSMGWFSERDLCNLCGESIYSYKCRHYPGERFPITDEDTGEETMQVCTYSCYGITPIELSLVYFPANPDGRLVTKAKAMVDTFSNEQIDRIESQLKVAIANPDRSTFDMKLDKEAQTQIATLIAEAIKPLSDKLTQLEKTDAETTTPQTASPNADTFNIVNSKGEIVRQIKEDEIPETPEPVTTAAVTEAVKTAIAPVTKRLDQIETAVNSGDGVNERKEAIDENVKQYNRIHGKDGNEEEHRASLEDHPNVESIKSFTTSLKTTADILFKEGRSTAGLGDELEKENDDEGAETSRGQRTANPM